jgi:hypothetical protein
LLLGVVYPVFNNLMFMEQMYNIRNHVVNKKAKHQLNLIILNSFLLMMEQNENMVVKQHFVLDLNKLFQVIFLDHDLPIVMVHIKLQLHHNLYVKNNQVNMKFSLLFLINIQ